MTDLAKSSDSYEKRLNTALVKFHKSLFNPDMTIKSEYLEHTDCPVCHSKDSKEVFVKDFFHYHRCQNCSMLFMNPRLNSEATVSFYNSDVNQIYNEKKFDEVSVQTKTADNFNIENLRILQDFIQQKKIVGKKLLEIGCAKGVFLKYALDEGFDVYGLELNKENAIYANELLGGRVKDIDLFQMNYPEGTFDIVYMRDVIEHIHNPDTFIREISRILRRGGILYLETHNIDGLIYQAVGARHTVIFGFEHPVHWSPRSIEKVCKNNHLRVELISFKSIDFMLKNILKYFLRPTFTTVFPWKVNPVKGFFLKCLIHFLDLPLLKKLDEKLLPPIANTLNAGSTMKVLAIKSEATLK